MYEKMYAILCGAASDAMDLLQNGETEDALNLLKETLLRTEEIYVEE